MLLTQLPLLVFAFGVSAFASLAYGYFRGGWRQSSWEFRLFTLACAAALISNYFGEGEWPAKAVGPLLLHVMVGRRWWPVLAAGWALHLFADPRLAWGLTAVAGLAAGGYWPLLGLLLAAMIGAWATESYWLDLAPDYVVLAYFMRTLYQQERLLFIDVFFRRGAYYVIGLVLAASGLVGDWWWLFGAWVIAPATAELSAKLVDRWILGRHYSSSEAEHKFLADTQSAATPADLDRAVEQSLQQIFGKRPLFSEDLRLRREFDARASVLRETLRQRELTGRAEMRALRAQINPHFLFNALNAIAGLIPTQPARADEVVEKLAEVFRYTLRQSEAEWLPLREELEFVRAYLNVEEARFGERLKVEWDVEIGETLAPAMLVQPLVENAIKHGAARAEAGGWVRVWARDDDGRVRVMVSDNGPGFGERSGNGGHGLRNVAERLRGHFGERAAVKCERRDGLTIVTLELPPCAS